MLRSLAGTGMAVLIVEQDLHLAFEVATRVTVMPKGQIVHAAGVGDFRQDEQLARTLLGAG